MVLGGVGGVGGAFAIGTGLTGTAGLTATAGFGGATGAVGLTAAGGIAPYQFAWSGGQKTEDIAQVAAGNYTLTLTDANGCTTAAQFAVPQPDALMLAANIGADTCENNNADF